jgi:hypothetical protein
VKKWNNRHFIWRWGRAFRLQMPGPPCAYGLVFILLILSILRAAPLPSLNRLRSLRTPIRATQPKPDLAAVLRALLMHLVAKLPRCLSFTYPDLSRRLFAPPASAHLAASRQALSPYPPVTRRSGVRPHRSVCPGTWRSHRNPTHLGLKPLTGGRSSTRPGMCRNP